MSEHPYTRLAWLPGKQPDFVALCRSALNDDQHALGPRLQYLASHGLDENDLNRLAGLVRKAKAAGHSLAPLLPFRLGLLSNTTSDFIVQALTGTALRHGIDLEIIQGGFGQALQEALSPDSAINMADCDAVLIAIDHHSLPLQVLPGDPEQADASVAGCLGYLNTLREGIHANGRAICILQTVPPPPESLFGSLDWSLPGTLRHSLATFNRRLGEMLEGSADLLLDVAGLAETVGLAHWHDPTLWNLAKLPFSNTFLPLMPSM